MELNTDLDIAKCVVETPQIVMLREQMQWPEKLKLEKNVKRFMVEHDGLSEGTVIVSSIDSLTLSAGINIKLHKSAYGKGIGKASIMLALSYCFDTLELMCVTVHVLSYNRALIALFKSCGFTNEETLRSRCVKMANGVIWSAFSSCETKLVDSSFGLRLFGGM